jgi:hypothetical protein
MELAMDLDKTNRYATNIQNRMAKGISTLAALDQHEYLLKEQDRANVQSLEAAPAVKSALVEVVGDSQSSDVSDVI